MQKLNMSWARGVELGFGIYCPAGSPLFYAKDLSELK